MLFKHSHAFSTLMATKETKTKLVKRAGDPVNHSRQKTACPDCEKQVVSLSSHRTNAHNPSSQRAKDRTDGPGVKCRSSECTQVQKNYLSFEHHYRTHYDMENIEESPYGNLLQGPHGPNSHALSLNIPRDHLQPTSVVSLGSNGDVHTAHLQL